MTQQIGQYRILSELGSGGMGVVYRAMDLLLEREVAIKRLRSEYAASPSVLERFRQEAQLQAKLNHPNIAQLYTLLQDGDSLCIVMEFIDGTVLRNFMPMTWESAVPVVLQILEALDYAHRRGVLHRDIKPENIVIDREGTVKVMDFGIAHALGAARLTRERVVIGTLEYMPPERILNREMDQRSDLYAVGTVLFEMLCGRLPFASESEYELLRAQVENPAPPVGQFVGGVPAFVSEAVRCAMEKDPARRYPSCGEMASFLRDSAAAQGCQLKAVAEVLEIKPQAAAGSHLTTVYSLCQRIDVLIQNGNYDTAERVADQALNEFPANSDLATRREKARQAAGQRPPASRETAVPDDPLSQEEIALRQTLLRLVALDAAGDGTQALATLHDAMDRYPGRTAFRIAEAYLKEKAT
ncbi:MAG TPA: serine/threonine-protein kinase [Bryobacteraceae bacterium]|jgi:serine/threonine-protein kinase|nr:serine/threonine-protein kinase [Bryobacteraceae bacterium]